MQVNENQKSEVVLVSQLINKINNFDSGYILAESDRISKEQPFLISLLLGFRFDLNEYELDEVMRAVFLIWEYFKDKVKVKVTEKEHEQALIRNIHMLNYFEGQDNLKDQLKLTESDLKHLKSKELFTGILFQFNHREPLVKMNLKTKGEVLIGLKSLIECLEKKSYSVD